MPNLATPLLAAVVLILILMVLVAAHELGHYLFARWFKMGVEEFAIGFGKPKLWTYRVKTYRVDVPDVNVLPAGVEEGDEFEIDASGMSMEGGGEARRAKLVRTDGGLALEEKTNFTFRPWPIGGFVRIKGMVPFEDGRETSVPGGFYSKPAWQRLIVLFAGPLFSILAGIVLLIPLFMFAGLDEPVNEPVIGRVGSPTPASQAGLESGDRIMSVNGQSMATFYDVLKVVRENAGKSISVTVNRNGETFVRDIVPMKDTAPTPVLGPDLRDSGELAIQGKLGIVYDTQKRKLPFGEAVLAAVDTPRRAIAGLVTTFQSVSNFERSVGGPGTMYKFSEAAVQDGIDRIISLAALLSISVGIFNLLPVYPLDGGQMVVALIEMLRGGKRLSLRVQEAIGTVGFAMVLMLFVSVIIVDVKRWMPRPESEQKISVPAK
jgi:regulator of sigma E protease